MSFQHGLSGLKAASAKLDVTGNNIANANTVGFKQSQAQFSDMFASSLVQGGKGNNQIGIGVQVAAVAQEFSQGSITSSNNPLDVAVVSNGFFRMNDNGAISYTRNGQFNLDKDGFLVNANHLNVTGFAANESGQIIPNIPVNLQLPTADLKPKSTANFAVGVNLDSRADVSILAFDATNPSTYTHTTSGEIFDSLGNSHMMTLFFQKTSPVKWDVYATVDGAVDVDGVPLGVTLGGGAAGDPLELEFDTSGMLTTPAVPIAAEVAFSAIDPIKWGGVATPLQLSFDLTQSTQFGNSFGVNMLSQDGFTSGRLAGYSIAEDGQIQGSYTNGVTRTLGQIALAGFSNPGGLRPIGNNQWAETANSGLPLIGTPLSGMLGPLQSSAVEESNVDLSNELVSLIMTQRVYQANAKTIQAQDAVMQTIVNI